MAINFETTITEADFKRALLDPAEQRLTRELSREPDLSVDGLSGSLLGWLATLFAPRRRR